MRTIDFSPLFRHSVGFDRMQRLLDAAAQTEQNNAYPPYNIEQLGESGYQITLAVAGFSDRDIDITLTDRTLVVSGKMNDGDEERTYLHRGIAGRAFERPVAQLHARIAEFRLPLMAATVLLALASLAGPLRRIARRRKPE